MECDPWPARAFGVEVVLTFEIPALRTAAVDRVADPTSLDLAEIAGWPAGEGEPLASLSDGRGGALVEVRQRPDVGILVDARSRGRFLVRPGARQVLCAPGDEDWRRVLVAQVLPVVAALRGLHVIHASAVSIGDGAVALAGASGVGKSTLAAELARAGHPMLADDVLALRLEHGVPVAEPGVSLPELPRAPHAMPLRALYLLDHAEGGTPSPRDLMATTFVPYLPSGAGHLDLAAALAGTVAVARVRVDRTRPPRELAARIEHDAESANRGAAFIRA